MTDPSSSTSRKPQCHTQLEAATWIVQCLVDENHVAYFAGGCVRDRLMGIPAKDYDIATSARPDEIRKIFPHAHSVGESFGVMLVRKWGYTIEVATFRTDGIYSDSRHPDEIVFTDAQHDAARRDFTINGLFENPLDQTIIDYVDGQSDLEAGVIRAIGDPSARLKEDYLRMLRAVRFAARFSFAIDHDTAEAIRSAAGDLQGISRERVGQEVKWMLNDRNRAVAAWELQYLGLDQYVLDEPNVIVAPVRLGQLPDDIAFPTALMAWLLDRHTDRSEALTSIAREWSRSLILSNEEKRACLGCLGVYQDLQDSWTKMGVARQKRLAADTAFREGLALLKTEDLDLFIEIKRHIVELEKTGIAPEPLIDGDDLIEEGFTPGPAFKRILDAVYDAQLEGSISNRNEAIQLANQLNNQGDLDLLP